MLTLLLSPIESLVNRVIHSDPDALQKIASLKNQAIKIDCTDWNIALFILPNESGLQFENKYDGKINTEIVGTLNHFFKLILNGSDQKALFQYPVEIKGNTHTIEVLRDAFKSLDCDLEEQLSKILGDATAHQLFFHAAETKNTLKSISQKLKNNLQEFIYFESKSFPTKKQVEKFYTDVATLRDDVERAELKVNRFIANRKKHA